jgi:hypothetical protein
MYTRILCYIIIVAKKEETTYLGYHVLCYSCKQQKTSLKVSGKGGYGKIILSVNWRTLLLLYFPSILSSVKFKFCNI